MDSIPHDNSVLLLSMANEDHYRKQADSYRNSPEYTEMKKLYPLLETYIEYCRDEKLIT
tara:strand:+ start:41 stop:217 length:177 start_codon:yes stop_codon:yes gene_type:complete